MDELADVVEEAAESEDMFLVGIGASAGGLEAIRTLLKAAPQDVPAAYIVLQHMAPTQKSMLTALIDRETHLTVHELKEPTRPKRNSVYVVPPNADAVYVDGEVRLIPPSTALAAPKPSADRFFRSIAEAAEYRAIGIVLSGTGSDGSDGIKAIREAGGITFAQDDKTAKYDGMPNSAIETGCIDLVLNPVEIGERLAHLSLERMDLSKGMKEDADQTPLTEILQILLAKTRVDFRDYKPTTILRRLERRMNAVGISSQRVYADMLRENDTEVEALFRDFLISVTRFFRDPEEFEDLRKYVDAMVDRIRNRPIRVWIAGCATGEEAYSIAILISEAMGGVQAAKTQGVQIFATDIDLNALRIAREGRYSFGALSDVPAEYVGKYFKTSEEAVTVSPDLKSMILFSAHNIVQDPPFMNVDLVCCRNVLIYFGARLQERAFGNFHYALDQHGKVFLGTADNASAALDMFVESDLGKKIFSRRNLDIVTGMRKRRRASYLTLPNDVIAPISKPHSDAKQNGAVNQLVTALVRSLGENALLLTKNLDIVNIFGNLTPFISVKGTSTTGFNHMLLAEPLASEVRVLTTMAAKEKQARRGFIRRLERLPGEAVQLEAFYLNHDEFEEEMYLIVFNTWPDEAKDFDPEKESETDNLHDQELQDELISTRNALNQTIEQWETISEELKSTNEELQSNNEELQSVNEELDASNEELQSTNEELMTVNETYQVTSYELSELNEELEAILEQMEAPLIVFDKDLRVSKYSRSAAALFNMLRSDGRPHLSQLALPPGYPPFAEACDRVIRLGEGAHLDFSTDGKQIKLTCAPFANTKGEIMGGTIFFT